MLWLVSLAVYTLLHGPLKFRIFLLLNYCVIYIVKLFCRTLQTHNRDIQISHLPRLLSLYRKLWILIFSPYDLWPARRGKDSVCNLRYGPRTRLVRGMYSRTNCRELQVHRNFLDLEKMWEAPSDLCALLCTSLMLLNISDCL